MFIDSDSYPFYLLFEKGSQVHIDIFSIEWCLVGCGPGHEGEDGEMPSSPARSSRDFVVSFFPRELFFSGTDICPCPSQWKRIAKISRLSRLPRLIPAYSAQFVVNP